MDDVEGLREAHQILEIRQPAGAPAAVEIGDIRRPSNRKAKAVLGWTPRQPIDEALLSTAGSLVRVGLIEAA